MIGKQGQDRAGPGFVGEAATPPSLHGPAAARLLHQRQTTQLPGRGLRWAQVGTKLVVEPGDRHADEGCEFIHRVVEVVHVNIKEVVQEMRLLDLDRRGFVGTRPDQG